MQNSVPIGYDAGRNNLRNKLYAVVLRFLYKTFTGLLILLFIVGLGFFLVYPLLKDFKSFWIDVRRIEPYYLGYNSTVQFLLKLSPPVDDIFSDVPVDGIEVSIEAVSSDAKVADLEEKNTVLSINSISVRGKVVDGLSQEAMLRGFWHYPGSGTPGKRGNVVIFGHRFDRIPPDPMTFFDLDKTRVGDKIVVSQKTGTFTYTIVETKVVEKNERSVFSDLGDYRLTLITCTPLWTAEKRLVVVAIQDSVKNVI